jgi:hypothetical protein
VVILNEHCSFEQVNEWDIWRQRLKWFQCESGFHKALSEKTLQQKRFRYIGRQKWRHPVPFWDGKLFGHQKKENDGEEKVRWSDRKIFLHLGYIEEVADLHIHLFITLLLSKYFEHLS